MSNFAQGEELRTKTGMVFLYPALFRTNGVMHNIFENVQKYSDKRFFA
jgi:ABC-type polar amino acid transport system ATPase subunit